MCILGTVEKTITFIDRTQRSTTIIEEALVACLLIHIHFHNDLRLSQVATLNYT